MSAFRASSLNTETSSTCVLSGSLSCREMGSWGADAVVVAAMHGVLDPKLKWQALSVITGASGFCSQVFLAVTRPFYYTRTSRIID